MGWHDFQEETAAVFRDAGCEAEVDAAVDGVRGTHNVDVYVTFTKYGIPCSWVIECKDWSSNIPKEKVAALQAIVSDVGADRGVIVSQRGFQSGAIRLAQKSNITLASMDDLKEYVKDEVSQREIYFLETQIVRMKHELSDLPRSKETPEYSGIIIHHFGMLSMAEWGFERIRLGIPKYPMRFSGTGELESTSSIEEFLSYSKELIADISEFIRGSNKSA